MNFSRHLRSSKSAGWLALLGLVGASSCARMLGLDDLEFTGPNGTQGGKGGEGQSSGVASEPIGGASGGSAAQGACGSACTGVCIEGVCCPTGHANCDGECFDLRTSARHCGSCETTCGAEQVCNEGRCSFDCGNLAQCGNDCVDLASNLNHCQRCDTRCFHPPMNGTAVCSAVGCDVQCNEQSKRCGNYCCLPPPENGNVVCDPDNRCQVQCNADHHACEGTEAPCYPDDDVQHCGANCYDCRQPNATVSCNGSRCANTCDGLVTFPCADGSASGKVACGIWDFESGTDEGWFVDVNGLTNAWTRTLEATQAQRYSGTNSLAFGFEGDDSRDTDARYAIELGVSLCPNGEAVAWPSHQFAFHYFFETASGDPPPHGKAEVYLQLRNGNMGVYAGCDSLQPNARGEWGVMTCDLIDIPKFTRMSLVFRIFHAPWTGTIYIDRVGWRDRQ